MKKKVNLEEENSLHFKAEIRTFVEPNIVNVALLSSHRFHCIWDVALKLFVFRHTLVEWSFQWDFRTHFH